MNESEALFMSLTAFGILKVHLDEFFLKIKNYLFFIWCFCFVLVILGSERHL